MTTQRWTLTDAAGNTWRMPINPDSMSPLDVAGRRSARHASGRPGDRRIRTMVGPPRAQEWTFGGVIRTRNHHDILTLWSKKPGEVRIVDHIGRTITVAFTSFEPTDRRPNTLTPWRMRYVMKCTVLEVS